MGCNCSGGAASASYQLLDPAGRVKGTFLTRTEAIAALSAAGTGHRVLAKR